MICWLHTPSVSPRPRVGIALKITDAEPLTLAVMQALLGYTSEARWLRYARMNLVTMFPHLPQPFPLLLGLRLHLVATSHGLPLGWALSVDPQGRQTLISDKGYNGAAFEVDLNQVGIKRLRPTRKGEALRAGERFFKPLRPNRSTHLGVERRDLAQRHDRPRPALADRVGPLTPWNHSSREGGPHVSTRCSAHVLLEVRHVRRPRQAIRVLVVDRPSGDRRGGADAHRRAVRLTLWWECEWCDARDRHHPLCHRRDRVARHFGPDLRGWVPPPARSRTVLLAATSRTRPQREYRVHRAEATRSGPDG